MNEKQRVSQFDRGPAVVFCQLVDIKAGEGLCQAFFDLFGEWLFATLPVKSEEFTDFADTAYELWQQGAKFTFTRGIACHFSRQQLWYMTQLLLFAYFQSYRGNSRGRYLRCEAADGGRNSLTILIVVIFPQQVGRPVRRSKPSGVCADAGDPQTPTEGKNAGQ